MADAQPGRLTIRIAQILLVVGAGGLWAASRLTWVELRTFDGLSPLKVVTLTGAEWSSGLLPLALVLLAAAIAVLAVRGWALRILAVLVALASLATGYLAVTCWRFRMWPYGQPISRTFRCSNWSAARAITPAR